MAKNAADVASKWSRNLGNATQAIQAGVQAVTVSPMESAAAQSNAYLQGVQNAVQSGKWQARLRSVSLQSWQTSMIQKGLPRIGSGATAAQPKMQAFMSQWLPYMDGLKSQLASTPRGSLDQNIQRMVAAARYNAAFKRT